MDFRVIHNAKSMSGYEIINKIGAGTYGVVYEAIDKETKEKVAIKKIRLSQNDDGVPSTAIREICLLKSLRHPNIVSLNTVIYQEDKISLIFEYVDYDLKKFMDSLKRPLILEEYRAITYYILKAIQFCHLRRCIHRDLKPQNVLISESGDMKLADFGLARTFCIPVRMHTHEVVTLWYRAPQILLGCKEYSTAIDIWSVGCILGEMATGHALFKGDSQIDQIFQIFKVLGTPCDTNWPRGSQFPDFKSTFPKWKPKPIKTLTKDHLDETGLDLLEKLVTLDPAKRITASEALRHKFFQGMEERSIQV